MASACDGGTISAVELATNIGTVALVTSSAGEASR